MPLTPPAWFDPDCRSCPRLSGFLDQVRLAHPSYHAAPVAPFGDPEARLLIVGLAPGLHGANRTGRPFTGDFAGILLYQTLHRHGFGSRDVSLGQEDGLRLKDCRITNAVKCLPPQNKPVGAEIKACNGFLRAELGALGHGAVVLALGLIAHNAVLRAEGLRQSALRFGHGRRHALDRGRTLLDSYHCSRYNTQTGRLTEAMFNGVVASARELLEEDNGRW